MKCVHPNRIFPTGYTTDNGKPEYYFDTKQSDHIPSADVFKRFGRVIPFDLTWFYEVPCGRCPQCRKAYSDRWAFRINCEASEYDPGSVWFFTLTYDDAHLPKDRKPSKKDLSKFMRALRKYMAPTPLRFFGCGEFGEKTDRPHIHVLIFGWDFGKWTNKIKYDGSQWTFPMIESLWKKGFCPGSQVFDNGAAGAYVAKYLVKESDRSGVWISSSLKPGIGLRTIEKMVQGLEPGEKPLLMSGDGKGNVLKSGIPKALRQRLNIPSVLGSVETYRKLFNQMEAAGYSEDDCRTYALVEQFREDLASELVLKEQRAKL